jgi:sporulation protein YlmC with PRC-barrel domain
MKPSMHRTRFLTSSICAAILAVPLAITAVDEKPRSPIQENEIRALNLNQNDDAAALEGAQRHSREDMAIGMINRASSMIGSSVMGHAGDEIAEVKDLVVDLKTGRLVVALLEPEGLEGFGSSYHAVPPTALKSEGRQIIADAGLMRASPRIDLGQWQQALDDTTLASIYRNYGASYDGKGDSWGNAIHADSSLASSERQREPIDVPEATDDRQLVRDQEEIRPAADPKPEAAGQSRDNWGPTDRLSVRDSSAAASSGSAPSDTISGSAGADVRTSSMKPGAVHSDSSLIRVSELLGQDVKTSGGDDLGTVKDLGIDLTNGRIATAVISSGGFLGIGDQLRVVPGPALKMHPATEGVQLSGTADQFKRQPHFKGQSLPVQNESYLDQLYRGYDLDPYFQSSGGKIAE